jgi:hypothetical protein
MSGTMPPLLNTSSDGVASLNNPLVKLYYLKCIVLCKSQIWTEWFRIHYRGYKFLFTINTKLRSNRISNISELLSAIHDNILHCISRNSSVSTALGYGLDDRGSRIQFLAVAGDFSLHHRVQNGSGAHPASYPMGIGGSFPGSKAAGVWNWPLTSI